ncbi:MAG TPA: hypothetical protein VGF08_07600 [Terriglobales bacterium]
MNRASYRTAGAIAACGLWLVSVPVAAQVPVEAPAALVRRTVENELNASTDASSFMFRARKETPRGTQTRLYVQTRDATAGMLVAVNDQPITPEQQAGEEDHLQSLVRNPDELKRKRKQEREDAERIRRIVRAMPDAFLYEYEGTEKGTAQIGRAGDTLLRLRFSPNPDYDPPSRVEQVLTGMKGNVLIDPVKCRIARIDGALYREVSFGWGIFGHLDKGGHFLVEQAEVADSHWDVTHMNLSFTGKILLFKSLNIKSNEVYSKFQRVPADLTFAQGVEMLKKEVASSNRSLGGQ